MTGNAGGILAVSPDGSSVYTAGSANGRIELVAHDAHTGSQEWITDVADGGADDVEVSPDGSKVFLAGSVLVDALTENFVTAAIDARTGAVLWGHRYSPGNGQSAAALGIATDGASVYVAGSFEGISGGLNDHWDFGTVAYDGQTGALLWTARFNGPDDSNDIPYAGVAINPDRTLLYVAGMSGPDSGGDYGTVAYATSDGSQVWVDTQDAGSGDQAHAMAVSPDGRFLYVTGYNFQASTETFAYDAYTGKLFATAISPTGGLDVLLAPDASRVYVAGGTVASYDSKLGGPLWTASIPHFGAISLTVSPDGTRVYATGTVDNRFMCQEFSSWDYATLAFDASTGTILWRAHYVGLDRASNDTATDVLTSPDGSSLFVSGNSDTCSSNGTVATLSYAA